MEEDEMEVKDNYSIIHKLEFKAYVEKLLAGFGILFSFMGFGIILLPIIIGTSEELAEVNPISYIVSGCILFTLSCGMFYMSIVLKYLRKIYEKK